MHCGPYGHGQPELAPFGRMGRFGIGLQYMAKIKVLMKKNMIFGQNWPIGSCFPIFAFFDEFTFAVVS